MKRRLLAALALAVSLRAGTDVESGGFRLHKMEQAIGRETYRVERDGSTRAMHSEFHFRDRGTDVALRSTLRLSPDGTPEQLEIHGSTSRFSTIDEKLGAPGFPIAGYAPVSVQMALVRYWLEQGRPASIARAKTGSIGIVWRGSDTVNGSQLDRYSISGLIWGRETLWLTSSRHLAAVVTVDAEFDHFEAVADEYESSLGFFVRRAAEDNMAALAEMAASFGSPARGVMAIEGATLIDGTASPPVRDAVVVIRDGRIAAAGARDTVPIPAGARVIDAHGRYLIPGLWDMHAHVEQVEWGPLYLAAGITTARDCGNEFDFIAAVRDAISAGHGLGPRLLLAGVVDGDGLRAMGAIRATSEQQARAVVDRYVDARFNQIKIYSSVTPEVVRALCAEAHRRGVTTTGHVPFNMNAREAVEDGMDGIEHFDYIQRVMLPPGTAEVDGVLPPIDLSSKAARDAIRFFVQHGTVLDPTLAVYELVWHEQGTPVERFEPGATKLAPELRDELENTGIAPARAQQREPVLRSMRAAVAALEHAGVPIIAGTDQSIPGWSLHREMELFVEGGMTPLEAIRSATAVPARVMKLDGEVGTIQAGRRADLLILDANPLADIRNTRRIWRVVAAGRLLDPAPLWRSVGFTP